MLIPGSSFDRQWVGKMWKNEEKRLEKCDLLR